MRRGLVADLDEARARIADGRVLVQGAVAAKPERQVAPGEAVVVQRPAARFVSRGGEKLDAALEAFGVDPAGRVVLDAGASTGGFTDCVLQRGAARVHAVDVGYGQLHERVARDERVHRLDRTNIRHLTTEALGGPVDLVVADLSFISLRTVIGPLLARCRPGADLVLLVKPQFEAERHEADRGRGVIADPAVWRRTLDAVIAAAVREGGIIMGAMVSPLTGSDGNVELLLHVRAPAPADPVAPGDRGGVVDVDALVDAVVASAGGA